VAGRSATSFDPLLYSASNTDLAQVFGTNQAALTQHFLSTGYAEGRSTASFDPLIYLASNPTLAQQYGDDPVAGVNHYITTGLAEGRPTTGFDPLIYIASNPDLAAAFGANGQAGLNHYLVAGADEGRATASFDPARYLASHSDLLATFGNDPARAFDHYLATGVNEGRATASFNPQLYLASHSDLLAAFGNNPAQALNHYLVAGFGEGRATASFDPARYLASHSDLLAAFGNNPAQALNHYLVAGFGEGRATATFNPQLYLASHSDLLAAFGNDPARALDHYLAAGANEGRTTSGFDAVAYLLSNGDFAGLSSEQALEHWLVAGFGEGRSGDTLFGREQGSDHLLLTSRTSQLDGDRDWFQFSGNAGEQFTLDLGGAGAGLGTLQDGILQIYDARGHLLATDDNSGPASDARVSFTLPASGTYYVVVLSPGSGAGTYQISLSGPGSLPPEEVKADSSPVVLPASDSGVGGEGEKLAPDGASEVLTIASEDIALIGPEDSRDSEVLAEASGELAKESGPQTLPGETEGLPTLMRDRATAAEFAPQDGDIAVTLSMFGDLPVDDGYLFVAGTDAGSPELMPVMSDDFVLTAKFEGPPVLPALEGDFHGVGFAKDVGPQTLPGEAHVFPALARDRVIAADFAPQDGDFAATLSLFGDLPVDDGYMFVAGTDAGSPEVLPAIADDFILAGKFEGPPVMPSPDADFDVVWLLKDIEFAQGLLFSGGGNSSNPNVSADGLTVYDDWSAFAAPTRHDVWG
jgi:hypothetical protein